MFEEFVNRLGERLQKPLPGADAQRLMMPVESTNDRFNLSKKDVRLGGVMLLFYPHASEIYMPLTQRHDYKGTHGGQVSLPGGKWEETDKTLEATALRETYEEIGVRPEQVKVIGKLSDLYIPPSNFRVSPFVGFVNHKPDFKIDSYEVKELIEAPLDHLLDENYRKRTNITVRSSMRINAPYFDIHGKVVWGATAMILSELSYLMNELK